MPRQKISTALTIRNRKARTGKKKFEQATNENLQPSRYRRRAWSVVGVAERDMPRWDREDAISHARELVACDPFIQGVVQIKVDNEVEDGFVLRPTTADEGFNNEVLAAWNEDKDNLDVRGIRSWGQLQHTIATRRVIDGDIGVPELLAPFQILPLSSKQSAGLPPSTGWRSTFPAIPPAQSMQ